MGKVNEARFYLSRLEDQRHLLRAAITGIRAGDLRQALTIATSIRVLVHETRSSTPLLKLLRSDYLSLPIREWINNPRNCKANLPLCVRISTEGPPIALTSTLPEGSLRTGVLSSWWNDSFISVPGVGDMSRRELILGLANKEGAHVDADLPEKYSLLLSNKFFTVRVGDREIDNLNISRLLAGSSGVLLLECLDANFPPSE
jgi:hypothetical protein